MDYITALKNIVRVGWVSSVNVEDRTARVAFKDKGETFVSGPLRVLNCQPLITVEKWVEEYGEENKWDIQASYASADRNLGIGESYSTETPDIIQNEKIIKYEKKKGIPEINVSCSLTGVIEEKKNKEIIKVYPWLPYIGELVLCIYLPNGEGDGFVIGGI